MRYETAKIFTFLIKEGYILTQLGKSIVVTKSYHDTTTLLRFEFSNREKAKQVTDFCNTHIIEKEDITLDL